MEEDGIQTYNKGAPECAANADSASKQIFERLVNDEEGHFDQYEKQHDNIKRFGLSYPAQQSYGGSAAPGVAPVPTE